MSQYPTFAQLAAFQLRHKKPKDKNIVIKIERFGLDTLEPDLKRTQEREKTSHEALVLTA